MNITEAIIGEFVLFILITGVYGAEEMTCCAVTANPTALNIFK